MTEMDFLSLGLCILFCSAFIKILVSLSIIRFGLGLDGAGIGLVLMVVSAALSLVVMLPSLNTLGGIEKLPKFSLADGSEFDRTFRPFLTKFANQTLLEKMASSSNSGANSGTGKGGKTPVVESRPGSDSQASVDTKIKIEQKVPLTHLIASFLLAELGRGFSLGFMLLVPLIVIDLLVVNLLMLLNVKQVSAQLISLPCKLLLFIAVDAWSLIAQKLINSYTL